MAHLVAPSLLSADFGNLSKDLKMINSSHADWLHLDIMDGVFVPNLSFGFPVLKAVSSIATKPLDYHLMIIEPEKYLEQFRDLKASVITIHYETSKHLHRSLQQIRSMNIKAGVAINPHTPVKLLEDVIQIADLLLIMSVNPGFGGQKFIEHSLKKIEQARQLIDSAGSEAFLQVDGGIDQNNIGSVLSAGADVVVAGNAIFGAPDPVSSIKELKSAK